ncbi:unnamed protein product, partial [Pylaiella littoralis]
WSFSSLLRVVFDGWTADRPGDSSSPGRVVVPSKKSVSRWREEKRANIAARKATAREAQAAARQAEVAHMVGVLEQLQKEDEEAGEYPAVYGFIVHDVLSNRQRKQMQRAAS